MRRRHALLTAFAVSQPNSSSSEMDWENVKEWNNWKGTPRDMVHQLYVVEDKQLPEVMAEMEDRLHFRATYVYSSFR